MVVFTVVVVAAVVVVDGGAVVVVVAGGVVVVVNGPAPPLEQAAATSTTEARRAAWRGAVMGPAYGTAPHQAISPGRGALSWPRGAHQRPLVPPCPGGGGQGPARSDADQVPADLRRVAGRPLPLPPPLALSLLKGIDRYDWLREKALEAWPEADAKAAGPEQASALLLQRPPGWVSRLIALAAGAGERRRAGWRTTWLAVWRRPRTPPRSGSGGRGPRRRRDRRGGKRRRLRWPKSGRCARPNRPPWLGPAPSWRARWSACGRRGRRPVPSGMPPVKRGAGWREALAEERRRRAVAEAARATREGTARWADDPLSMAAHLDWTAGVARLPGTGAAEEAVGMGAVLHLPEGVRPDEKAAVDWLAVRAEPTTVIVDGYNAAFKLTSSRDPAAARRRLLMALDRLQKVARGPMRVVAVFDSRLGPVGEVLAPGPVEVRFTAEEGGADADIAVLAGALSGARRGSHQRPRRAGGRRGGGGGGAVVRGTEGLVPAAVRARVARCVGDRSNRGSPPGIPKKANLS